ncbi:MAG: DUF4834 family protein [Alistipes sp.]|nr:DUF4834 family protein [Alistipes sp.]
MKSFFSFIAEFISRNPLTVVLLVVLCVAAPQVMGLFALVLLVPLLLALFGAALFWWRLRRVRKEMEQQMHRAEQQGRAYTQRPRGDGATCEGDITVVASEPRQKRVSDDVGEYIDFKEVE